MDLSVKPMAHRSGGALIRPASRRGASVRALHGGLEPPGLRARAAWAGYSPVERRSAYRV